MRRNSAISGFDFFDVEDVAEDLVSAAKVGISRELGAGPPQLVALSTYVKPSGMSGLENAAYFWNRRGWAVVSTARNEVEAGRIGKRVQSNLVAARNLSASDPYVHTLPLFVIYSGKWIRLEPTEKKAAPKTVSLTDEKARIVQKGDDVFGAGSISIGGKQGDYSIYIDPKKPKAKKLFRPASVRATDLTSLEAKLDMAIAMARSHGI